MRHGLRGRGGFPNSASVGQPHTWRAALAVTRSPHDLEHRLCSIVDMVATPQRVDDCRAPSVSYTGVVLGPFHYGLVEIALGGNLRVCLDENDAIGGSVCQGEEIATEDTCDEPSGKRSRCNDTKCHLHDEHSFACSCEMSRRVQAKHA